MHTDGRLARGATSRRAVMRAAMDLASVEGLERLSIGALATETAMSKGGIVALFGAKEQLQLATVAAAAEVFRETVVVPALAFKGIERLHAVVDAWLRYSETRVFRGGCFFAAVSGELAASPAPVREAVVSALKQWYDFLGGTIDRAVAAGEMSPQTDAQQLVFEMTSMLDGANSMSLLLESAEPYARARAAIGRLLAAQAS